jgi:hypothetical protein
MLLQGSVDVGPWVSALRVDEGVGEAPCWFHVHREHVDLGEVVPVGDINANSWGRKEWQHAKRGGVGDGEWLRRQEKV